MSPSDPPTSPSRTTPVLTSSSAATILTTVNRPKVSPNLIRNGERGIFQAESAGVMTGDQGHVDYSNSAGRFTFNFDNPFVGDNAYDQSVPSGFVASHNGGSSDNAEVI